MWIVKRRAGAPHSTMAIVIKKKMAALEKIVRPAEAKFNQLLTRRAKQLPVENI